MITIKGKTPVTIQSNHESDAIEQLKELSNKEWVTGTKVVIMPDYHAGKGAVIGTTVKLGGRVDPMAVGVDIGCAVSAVRIAERDFDPEKLERIIEEHVPSGMNIGTFAHDFPAIDELIAPVDREYDLRSLGSLGGGNHFIEVDRDSTGHLWLIVHCGSRHLGVEIAKYHQKHGDITTKREKRRKIIHSLKEAGREREIENALRNFSVEPFLEGTAFDEYIHDMKIAQAYSRENHRIIENAILGGMGWHPEERIMTMHNYIDTDNMILRKGAVSAQKGEIFLCPMNMHDGTLLCIGKGNPGWNFSAPHGAGRILSRTKAKAEVSMKEFEESMRGVWSRSVCESTLDESPFAYKPMDEILEVIGETAEVVETMKPVFNYKAH